MQIGLLIESLDKLETAAEWGYDYVEIVPWLLGPDEDDPIAEQQARDRILAAKAPVRTMCGFLPDPRNRRLMVVGPDVDWPRLRAYTTRVFDRMQRVGIDVIGFGSGDARWVPDGFPVDRALAQLRAFLAMCADLGEPRGVRVAIEPYNREDANLVHTVPEALTLARAVDRPSIGVMADFFHMGLNGEPLDDVVAAAGHLLHAHIAEPGRGRPPSTPADHEAFFRVLLAAGYNGCVTQTGELAAYASPTDAAASLKRLARAASKP